MSSRQVLAKAAQRACRHASRAHNVAPAAPARRPNQRPCTLWPLTRGRAKHGRLVAPHQLHQVVCVGEVGVGVAAAKVLQRHAVADRVLWARCGGGGAVGRGEGRQSVGKAVQVCGQCWQLMRPAHLLS